MEIVDEIKQQLELIRLNGRIPDRSSFDKEKLVAISKYYDKNFISEEIVGDVIFTFTFETSLRSDVDFNKDHFFKQIKGVDLAQIASAVHQFLLNLPISYSFKFKLPDSSVPINTKITHNIRIETLESDEKSDDPVSHYTALILKQTLFIRKGMSFW